MNRTYVAFKKTDLWCIQKIQATSLGARRTYTGGSCDQRLGGIEELKDDQNVGALVGIQEACSKPYHQPSLQIRAFEFLML